VKNLFRFLRPKKQHKVQRNEVKILPWMHVGAQIIHWVGTQLGFGDGATDSFRGMGQRRNSEETQVNSQATPQDLDQRSKTEVIPKMARRRGSNTKKSSWWPQAMQELPRISLRERKGGETSILFNHILVIYSFDGAILTTSQVIFSVFTSSCLIRQFVSPYWLNGQNVIFYSKNKI